MTKSPPRVKKVKGLDKYMPSKRIVPPIKPFIDNFRELYDSTLKGDVF